MPKKKRMPPAAIPANREEADRLMAEIADFQRQIETAENELNAEVDRLKAESLAKVRPLIDQLAMRANGICIWANAHREELIAQAGKKTIEFINGIIRWYKTPWRIVIKDEVKAVVDLKARGLNHLIRMHEEPNREAIKEHPEQVVGIKGITATQDEIFAIYPAAVSLEVTVHDGKVSRKKPE